MQVPAQAAPILRGRPVDRPFGIHGRVLPSPLNACHLQCLLGFSVCGYLAWETQDYCNQQLAHCMAGCGPI